MRYQVDDGTGCWNWSGNLDAYGRAERLTFDGAKVRPYRLAYELLVGPIPPAHHVHHVCGNPRCINPGHLEAILPVDHSRLHAKLSEFGQTHCRNGHPFDERNTYINTDKTGRLFRQCRACKARREKERQRRLRLNA
jgi:hypothetical protein